MIKDGAEWDSKRGHSPGRRLLDALGNSAGAEIAQSEQSEHRAFKPHWVGAKRVYMALVTLLAGLLLFFGTVLLMEVVAYAAHRWVMHGPGWFLHASHHRQRHGLFEANDLYALIFAIPSIVLLQGGVNLGWGSWAIWVGAGIAAYGLIYFGFHDVIVHRRVPNRYLPRSSYMKRIIQAHRLHHVTEGKHGSVSFGFLWAPRPELLKRQLAVKTQAVLRSPRA